MRKQLFLAVLAGFLGAVAFAQGDKPVCLMFGEETPNPDTKKFLGFSFVSPGVEFKADAPWGFREGAQTSAWGYDAQTKGSLPADVLLEHGVVCKKGTFSVRVPNGPCVARLWLGDWFTGIRRMWPNNHLKITAEGKVVFEETVTPGKALSERWWLREKDKLYSKNIDTWTRLVKPVLDEVEFTVDVKDGTLDLALENILLTALVVIPAGDAAAMKAQSAAVEKERRRQFAERYPWKPKPDEPMPQISKADEARGFILFQKYGGDMVYPWTRPTQDEVTDSVRVFAARDEQEPARFGILPLRELKGFTVQVGDFVGPNGAKIATATCADLWRERYKEMGSKSTTAKVTDISAFDPFSDILLEPTPLDCEPGIPKMFTLDIRVPEDAAPGFYKAPVVFRSAGKDVAEAEIVLRVLPFTMEYAPVPFAFQTILSMWPDRLPGYDSASVHNAVAERVGFVGKYRFNFTEFVPPWGYGIDGDMRWGAIKGEPGSRHFTQTPAQEAEMDWWFKLIQEKGNAKDWVQLNICPYLLLHAGWFPGAGKNGMTYGKPGDSPETLKLIRKDIINIIQDIERIGKRKGYPKICWYAAGEPDNHGLSGVEDAVEMGKLVHEAGATAFCTINGAIAAKMTPPVYDVVMANFATPISDEFIAYVKSFGHKFGSHNTGDSRLAAGWQFWRMDGVMKYQEAIFYVDFLLPFAYLPWNYNTALVYPAENMGWRPTLRFLVYRDGRDDFMYLWNLSQLLEKARKAGLSDTPAAKEADAFLKDMRKRVYVDPAMYFSEKVDAIEATGKGEAGWTSKRYERYRWLLATLIMDLRDTLKEGN